MKHLVMLLLSSLSAVAFATPKKYQDCSSQGALLIPDGFNKIFFDEACDTAYLLPASRGKITVTGVTPHVTAGICRTLQTRIKAIEDETARLGRDWQARQREVARSSPAAAQLARLEAKCRKLGSKEANLALKVEKIQLRIEALETQKSGLERSRSACESDCQDITRDIADLEIDIADTKEELVEPETSLAEVRAEVNGCEKELSATREYEEKTTRLNADRFKDLESRLADLQKTYLSLIRTEMGEPGATLAVTYSSQQAELVRRFEELNPRWKGRVRSMPVRGGFLHFTGVSPTKRTKFPGVLSMKVLGQTLSTDSQGQESDFELDVSSAPTRDQIFFGTAAAGDIVVNRLLGCSGIESAYPSRDSDLYSLNASRLGGLLTATAVYRYNVEIDRSISFKVNYSHLYQLIREQTEKKRGLFDTETANRLLEASSSDLWVEVVVRQGEGDAKFEDVNKLALETKRNLLDGALRRISAGYLSQVHDIDLVGTDIKSGAAGGAKVLRENCPNFYCQVGAVALDLGNALFGGKTSRAEMAKVMKATELQIVTIKEPQEHYDDYAFVFGVGK